MNKKITIFNLALLVLIGGFGPVKAAEQQEKQEMSEIEKATAAAAKGVYENATVLKAAGGIVVNSALISAYWASSLCLLPVLRDGVFVPLRAFGLCVDITWLLVALKYCVSNSMDYGLKATSLAAGGYLANKTYQEFYHGDWLVDDFLDRLPRVLLGKFGSLMTPALMIAAIKCAICIGRKVSSNFDAKFVKSQSPVQKQDVAQQAGLDVASAKYA